VHVHCKANGLGDLETGQVWKQMCEETVQAFEGNEGDGFAGDKTLAFTKIGNIKKPVISSFQNYIS